MAELVDTEQTLTDEDYRNFEQLFAREIPPSFRAHYMSFNGGCTAEEDVEAGRWRSEMGFSPIKYGKLPIEQLIEDMGAIEPEDDKFGSWAPYSYVPFAGCYGGDLFLSLRDSDYGCVYIYFPDGSNIFFMASSFEEFREKLYRPKSA